jgi:hypothetical protein
VPRERQKDYRAKGVWFRASQVGRWCGGCYTISAGTGVGAERSIALPRRSPHRRSLTGIPFQFDSDDPNLWLQKMPALAVVGAVLVCAVILGASVLRIVGGIRVAHGP